MGVQSALLGAILAYAVLAGFAGQAQARETPQTAEIRQSAQTAPPSPGDRSALGGRPAAQQPGAWDRALYFIRARQQEFYKKLVGAIKAFKAEGSLTAAAGLIFLSFLYGIFHAAGPGHGKAVISVYLLADGRLVRRGIALAFASSLVQALTAIALVTTALFIFAATGRDANKLVAPLETASYALVCLIGFYMLWRALAGDHGHGHEHRHDHSHDPAHGDGCGHGHFATPAQLDGPMPVRRAAAIVLAVGIRPCSGAILVLVFARALGIYAAGVAATFAMALGTAITVSSLAVLTLLSKQAAVRLMGRNGTWLPVLQKTLAVAGALAIIAIGGVLLVGSWGAPRPLL